MRAALATIGIGVAAVVPVKQPERPADKHGCGKSYARTSALRGVRSIMRSPWRLTVRRGAIAWKFTRCTRTGRSERLVRHELLRLRAYRRSYGGYWTIRRRGIPTGLRGRLARLRWCESTNNYRATNGSHWGAYQYAPSTWQRAQSFAGTPARYRTWSAHVSSPAHQDAVTARFWPSHRSEWVCGA